MICGACGHRCACPTVRTSGVPLTGYMQNGAVAQWPLLLVNPIVAPQTLLVFSPAQGAAGCADPALAVRLGALDL